MTDKEQDKLTSQWLNLVNQNHDYAIIVKYIQEKFSTNLSYEELKKIIECLINLEGYTKEEILSGHTDKKISYHIKNIMSKNNSVIKNGEKKVYTPLKTKKKKVSKKIVSYLILGTMSVSSIAITVDLVKDYSKTKYISDNLGLAVAEKGSYEETLRESIVTQNTYRTGVDKDNKPIFAYSPEGIAKDILSICKNNDELLDVCLYDVFNDMIYDTFNNLDNMDDIIFYLKMYIKDLPDMESAKNKIVNCEVFLDYLVNRGFVNPNGPDYYEIMQDIKEYKICKETKRKVTDNLDKNSQDRIKKLLRIYNDNLDNLYDEYREDIAELNEDIESFGGRI